MSQSEYLMAFGVPGIEPHWTSSEKEGVGAGYLTSCQLWLTLNYAISPAQVGQRADHTVGRLRGYNGQVLMFSSGHFLRVLAARWLGLEPAAGRFLMLKTAALSAVGYENDDHKIYIDKHGEDLPEVRNWRWQMK